MISWEYKWSYYTCVGTTHFNVVNKNYMNNLYPIIVKLIYSSHIIKYMKYILVYKQYKGYKQYKLGHKCADRFNYDHKTMLL